MKQWLLTLAFFLLLWGRAHWQWLTVALGFLLAWVSLSFWAGLVVAIGLTWALIGSPFDDTNRPPRHGWWDQPRMAQALIESGVLHGPPDAILPLRYIGRPVQSEHGTSLVLVLPQAKSINDVQSRKDQIAASLGVPLARLEAFQHEDDPANLVRFHVTHGRPRETRSTVATAESTDWLSPVRGGFDTRGEPIFYQTFEHNALIAGIPGSGKTSFVRIPLSHFLLDPRTDVYILDGKGSVKDYGECRELCKIFVSGTDDNAVPDTLAMLLEVLDEVRRRNTAGGTWPGVFVLLEEFQDIRASATKDQRDQLDAVLGRIVRMGRAVGVHVAVSTQRPTVDDLPAGVRNLLSQRAALVLRNGQDAALVLGVNPSVPVPTRRGQVLFTVGGPVIAMVPDRLTNEDWSAVCERAARMRRTPGRTTQAAPELPAEPSLPVALDPLLQAVVEVLEQADPRGLPAEQLHSRLPDWTHDVCPTGHALGLKLAKHPDQVERAHIGSARGWRLASRKVGV